jgi:hypothetical protein
MKTQIHQSVDFNTKLGILYVISLKGKTIVHTFQHRKLCIKWLTFSVPANKEATEPKVPLG